MKEHDRMTVELQLAHAAETAGRHHAALFHWLRSLLIAPDAEREPLCHGRPMYMLPWAFDRRPAAFLACFTKKDGDYVLPLKLGVNRLGASSVTADHEIPASVHLVEERQWFLIHGVERRTFVADDRSSSGSVLLRRDSEVLAASRSPGLAAMRLARERVDIDRSGDTLCSLNDGDVLATFYGAFLFVMSPEP